MKTIVEVLIIGLIFGMALSLLIIYVMRYVGKPNPSKYLDRITAVEVLIEKLPINSESCDTILNAFDDLSTFADRDRKRNQAAFKRFCQRFKKVWNERTEDEFSPENVFHLT